MFNNQYSIINYTIFNYLWIAGSQKITKLEQGSCSHIGIPFGFSKSYLHQIETNNLSSTFYDFVE